MGRSAARCGSNREPAGTITERLLQRRLAPIGASDEPAASHRRAGPGDRRRCQWWILRPPSFAMGRRGGHARAARGRRTPQPWPKRLFAADLSKAKSRGAQNGFTSDAYIPPHLIRGELAEKWEWLKNGLQMKITLRKDVMFPEKPGVMQRRELVADDVVYSFKRVVGSRLSKRTSTTSRTFARKTSTRSCSRCRSSTPSGSTASATGTTPDHAKGSLMRAPRTGRTSTAAARSS